MCDCVAVLFVHGVEVATAEYAATAARLLRESFTPHAGVTPSEGLVVVSAVYSGVFEARESALLHATGAGELGAFFAELRRLAVSVDQGDVAALIRLGLQAVRRSVSGATRFHWPLLRWLVVNYLGDAVAYQLTPDNRDVYDEVQDCVLSALEQLAEEAGPDAPLCVIAHSLGSVVVTDLLGDLQNDRDPARESTLSASTRARVRDAAALVRGETLARLYTLGSPIALWTLRSTEDAVPLAVPDPAWCARYPSAPGGWVNVLDEDDVVAYPLAELNAAYRSAVTDRWVRLRPWWLSWTPVAHPFYWNDRKVVERIGRELADLRAALRSEEFV